jgi:hypothetical protein
VLPESCGFELRDGLWAAVVGAPAPGDVGFEGVACGVIAVGEQLDGEVVVGPVTVDDVAAVVDVRAWQREAVVFEELEEAVFEDAERDVGGERAAQLGDAPSCRGCGRCTLRSGAAWWRGGWLPRGRRA